MLSGWLSLRHRPESQPAASGLQVITPMRWRSQVGSTSVSIPDSTTLISEYNILKGYDSAKTLLTERDEKGQTRTVVMTKFDGALSAVNADGSPAEYICTVTVLDATLSGLT